MLSTENKNGHVNAAFTDVSHDRMITNDNSSQNQDVIEMHEGDTSQVQMSVDSSLKLAPLSPRITVTFHNVSKVINVPAKMVDPTSKERFIQRTLLDQVSGQVHPGQ